MKLISLREFKRVSGISAITLLQLLEENRLPCAYSKEDGISIDLDQFDLNEFLATLMSAGASDSGPNIELVEAVSTVLRQEIDVLIQEALSTLDYGNLK